MAIDNFKFWCQKVLPLVYDDSLSYYEVLCKVSSKLNEVINSQNGLVQNLPEAIKNVINDMINSGELQNIIIDNLLKNSIRCYDSVSDMLKDTNTAENNILFCKGYYEPLDGGESFFLTSSNLTKKPHLSANNLNYYWLVYGTVSVKQFGAKGDKLSDDTQAFQNALDTGYNVLVPMMYGQHYMINNTLTVSHDRCVVYGDLPTHYFMDYRTNDDFSDYSHGAIVCNFNNTNDPLFLCTGQFQTFANLAVVRNNLILVPDDSVGNIAIKFDKNTDNGTDVSNVDGEVRNCLFRHFNHAVELWGRGLWYTDCYNIHNNVDFYVKFKTSNWWKEEESSTSMLQTYPEFYGRGIRFQNNRIHTSLEWTVRVDTESVEGVPDWNGNVLNGAIIANNQMDLGRGGFLFNAPLYGCTISDNVFFRLSTNGITFTNKVKNTLVSNNVIRGLISTVRPSMDFLPLYGIYCSGDVEGLNISNNTFDKINLCGIILDNNNTTNLNISNNTFTDYSYKHVSDDAVYNYTGVVLNGTVTLSTIVNNNFKPKEYRGNFGVRAKSPTTSVWTNVVILGNTAYSSGLTPYALPTGAGTERNTLQDY